MMNERGRSKDLQLLSEYLDSRLSETQKRKFEARLAEDSALRERFENLRKTKLMLSRLSRVNAPRHFTLTPEMVKVRRRKQPLLTMMRWASSVAAILLVVLFGADLIFKSNLIARPMLQAAPVMESMTYAEDSTANTEATPEPLILWGVPNAAGSGGGSAESEAFGLGGGGGSSEEPVIETGTPPEEVTEEVATLPTETTSDDTRIVSKEAGESPILGLNPEQGGEIVSSSTQVTAQTTENWLSRISAIQWVEIALAVIALGSGVTWLIIRKR